MSVRTKQHLSLPRDIGLYAGIAGFLAFWIWMAVSPTDRLQWLFENILVVLTVLALALTYRRFRFSTLSYLLILLFLCLHAYAAHFTYDKTPFDTWLRTVFHTKRSYYDRVVHLAFGLLWAYPFRELLVRLAKVRGWWSYGLTAAVSLCLSAIFEILELAAAAVAGKGGEERFIGLQGDPFDTQKDMAISLLGVSLAIGLMLWKAREHRRTSG